MIFNEHLNRLMEVKSVQNFMQHHHMNATPCSQGDNHSFLIYRLPYVVEFQDNLIENYLEITLSDLNSDLLIQSGSALGCSVDLGLQNLDKLRQLSFENHPQKDIFLSFNVVKSGYLECDLEAISKLLPLIEAKGGLASMRDGALDSRFDFSQSVQPMYPGLKEKYLRCIQQRKSMQTN